MLGKLIKYEWKSVCQVGLILLGAIAMATLMGLLGFQAPMWNSMRSDSSFGAVTMNIVGVMALLFYVLLLVGAVYAIFIYIVVHFYRSMYTDEGYLLHTLPVTENQILVSKILVGSVWIVLIFLGVILSLLTFFCFLMSAVTGESIGEVLKEISGLKDLLQYLFSEDILDVGSCLSLVLNVVIGVPANLIVFFGAVSLGQLFSKHRVLMAILCYMGIAVVTGILQSVLQGIFYTGVFGSGSKGFLLGYLDFSMISSLILNVVLAVGCYLASYFINARKLNLG